MKDDDEDTYLFSNISLVKDLDPHGAAAYKQDDVIIPFILLNQHMNDLKSLSSEITNSSWQNVPTQNSFMNELEDKSDSEFFQHLRITKATFSSLLGKVSGEYTPKHRGGRLPVEAKLALMLCLWYLGNKEPYRKIGGIFGVSEACAFKAVHNMINIICKMGETYIKWPSGNNLMEVENKFKNICGFPGVVGVIDGCHIRIKAPLYKQNDFIDLTNKHSVNLMAVCDSDKRFIFVDAGFPGSAHVSNVLENTPLYQKIVNSPIDLFPSAYYHIIGDSAFHLSNHLLVPFKDFGNLNETQNKYNMKLFQTHSIIEDAFGLLKVRFRRLKLVDADLNRIPQIITACCIIHNITLESPQERELLSHECSKLSENVEVRYDDEELYLPEIDGSEKRNFIASIL